MELAEARALVHQKTDKQITVRHLISVEGVMRALARRLGEDQDRWALAGLFHDLDQDRTGEDSSQHAYLAAEWLREAGWRSRWSTPSWPTRTSSTAPT
jgi:uncharacterized protein